MGGVLEPEKLKAWATASLAWAKRQWPDQLASFVIHTDEQNVHAHLLVIPRVKSSSGVWKLNSKALFDRERLRELQTSYGEAMAPLGIRRGEPGSTATHSEVCQFYGVVNASQSLPERIKLPPAPKAPTLPSGMAVEAADAVSSAFGFETPHRRAVKEHAEAMKRWRETCKELKQQDAKVWESMKAHAAMAPLRQRCQRTASLLHNPTAPKTAPTDSARPKPRGL